MVLTVELNPNPNYCSNSKNNGIDGFIKIQYNYKTDKNCSRKNKMHIIRPYWTAQRRVDRFGLYCWNQEIIALKEGIKMEFKNVTVIKKANVYFEGKVTSRTILFEDGTKKTLGFMLAGEYEFNTDTEELMEVLGGDMEIMLKGETGYKTFNEGQSFVVPAKSSFKIIIGKFADYCCSYK